MAYTATVTRVRHRGQMREQPLLGGDGLRTVTQTTGQAGKQG